MDQKASTTRGVKDLPSSINPEIQHHSPGRDAMALVHHCWISSTFISAVKFSHYPHGCE